MPAICLYLRYGDSTEHEFGAWVKNGASLREALGEPIRRAMDRGFLPGTFAESSYSLEHNGRRVDLGRTLEEELARVGRADGPWMLTDSNAPLVVQVVARVDGPDGERSQIISHAITPPRSSRVGETLVPASLFSDVRFRGQTPRKWRVRAGWPGRVWFPWGRWNTRVGKLVRNQVLEVAPSLREWRCYRREIISLCVSVALVIVIALLAAIAGCRPVTFQATKVPTTIVVGSRSFRLPENRTLTKWVPRGAGALIVLPERLPVIETRASTIAPAAPGDTSVTVSVQCHEAATGSATRCPGVELKLNQQTVGSLQEEGVSFAVPVGRYEVEITNCPQGWNILPDHVEGVAFVHEIRNGRDFISFVVPADGIDTEHLVANLSVYRR